MERFQVRFANFRQAPHGRIDISRFTLLMAAVKLIEMQAARPPSWGRQL
jgi:hypothetical protein